MIEGRFKADYSTPAPYVKGYVEVSRLGAAGPALFHLDTGADFTTLHRSDMRDLGITPDLLGPQRFLVRGVGGVIPYAKEPAVVRLFDSGAGAWRSFSIMLDLYAGEEEEEEIPSLLGLDVLNRCRCAIDASTGSVLLEPVLVDEASGAVYYPPAVRRLG